MKDSHIYSSRQSWSTDRPGSIIIVGIGVAILTTALLFQFVVKRTARLAPSSSRRFDLATNLPSSLPGWQANDLPLGPNEFSQNRTAEILRYDDYVFREFSRGLRNFSVYAAYWSPGKMPTRLVALHTPDRCWTANGWSCLDKKFGVQINSTPVTLPPAEWRIFSPPDGQTKLYVYFWLMTGNRPYDFGHRLNTIPDPFSWWEDVVHEVMVGNQEHLFVRITSNRPFEELTPDPAFQSVVKSLADFGLRVVSAQN